MTGQNKRLVIRIKKDEQRIRLVTLLAFLTVVCLPFHTITFGGIGLLMLTGIPLLFLSLPVLLVAVKRLNQDKLLLLLTSFFAYNLLAYIWTPAFSIYSLYNYIKIIVVVLCMYCQTYNKKEKYLLLSGAIIAFFVVCWFMLTESHITYTDRRMTVAVFGVEQDPNYLGLLFVIPMTIFVYQFINYKTLSMKVLFALLAMLVLYCVLMTGSRGALLGSIVASVICVIMRFDKWGSKIAFSVFIVLLIIPLYNLVLGLMPDYIASRFTIQSIIRSGGTGRTDIWRMTFRVIKNAPYKVFFGFGSGSSIPLVGWATHNFILQLLLEVGLVGTSLFLMFLWNWAKKLIRQDTMCLAIIMACMAMSMTLSVNTIYYFWIVFTLGIVCSKARTPAGGEIP